MVNNYPERRGVLAPMIADHDNPAATYVWYISARYSRMPPTVSTVHNEGQNIAFMDGHSKWYKPSAAQDHNYDGGPLQWADVW